MLRKIVLSLIGVLALVATVPTQGFAQGWLISPPVNPASGSTTSVTSTDNVCILTRYVGAGAGKQTVEVAAGGDITYKLATVADATTGSPSLNGIFDLSTPAAAVDTYGELVSLINTTGSNWKAVLVNCLAADTTDNTLVTLAATDATTPKGVALYRDNTVSLTSLVSALPPGADTDIRFWTTGTSVNTRINPNPFGNFQTFVQAIHEKITSSGTVGQFRILGITPTYSSTGVYSEVVRVIFSTLGGATTVDNNQSFDGFPIVGAPNEKLAADITTGTALTVINMQIGGFTRKVNP